MKCSRCGELVHKHFLLRGSLLCPECNRTGEKLLESIMDHFVINDLPEAQKEINEDLFRRDISHGALKFLEWLSNTPQGKLQRPGNEFERREMVGLFMVELFGV